MSSHATHLTSLFIVSDNFLRKTVRQRHLIWNFVVRDLKSRYVGSFMGFFWSVVHPLVLLVSYTFVFSVIFKIKPHLEQIDNFPVFLFSGILPWLYFQDTVVRSCNSVVDHGNLIRKTVFPSEILPLSLVLSNLLTHLVGLGILFLVLFYINALGWAALFLPIYIFLLMLLALGLGWLAAAVQVFLRDTSQVLSVTMVFWFWFTPIFYGVERVPEVFRPWIRLNPISHAVEGYRALLLTNEFPHLASLGWLAAAAVAAAMVGGVVFRNTKREFVDVL